MFDTSDFVDNLNRINGLTHEKYPCLLTDEGRSSLDELLGKMKQEDPLFVRCILKDWLKSVEFPSRQPVPPLEMIWKLNEEELLFVTTYFYVKKDYVATLIESFQAVYRLPHDDDDDCIKEAVEVVSNVVVVIINSLKHHNKDLRLFFLSICKRISVEATELIISGSSKNCYLTDLRNCIFLFDACYTEFVLLGLKQFLSSFTGAVECDFALKNHRKLWSADVMEEHKRHFLEKVTSILTDEILFAEFQLCVETRSANLDGLMCLLSILAVEKPDAMALIKDRVTQWLSDSDPQIMRVALLVARHSCYHKAKFFKSYVAWLDTLPWKSMEFVSRFHGLLTDLVPHESPLYLKIHATYKPPSSHGLTAVVDYVNLAKTRLSDMNESLNYKGIFGDAHDTDAERRKSDVLRAIAHFKERHEVAQPVLELATLSKQYYETVFLKELLKVREDQDSVRATFINALYSKGQVPQRMYLAWKNPRFVLPLDVNVNNNKMAK